MLIPIRKQDITEPSLQIMTSPNNIMIRQGDELLIPARIKSTSGFSNDVVNLIIDNNNEMGSDFNVNEVHLTIQEVQPPLFKITVPKQTPLGIYSIPMIVTVREPSVATLTKPIAINEKGGIIDPEFELSEISNNWIYYSTTKFNNNSFTTYYY